MDGNVIANIHLALVDEILSSVAEKKTIKKIWNALTKLYESKSLHNKIFLKRRLYTLQMTETTSVTDHIVARHLRGIGFGDFFVIICFALICWESPPSI